MTRYLKHIKPSINFKPHNFNGKKYPLLWPKNLTRSMLFSTTKIFQNNEKESKSDENKLLKELMATIEEDNRKSPEQKHKEDENLINQLLMSSYSDTDNQSKEASLFDNEIDPFTGQKIKKNKLKTNNYSNNNNQTVQFNLNTPKKLALNQYLSATQIVDDNLSINDKSKSMNYTPSFKHDPIVTEVVNNVMKKGDKQAALKLISNSLIEVINRTNKMLNMTPLEILHEVINKTSPLFRINKENVTKIKIKLCPVPLTKREQHRFGIVWILEAASKHPFADRYKQLAYEMLLVLNGTSSALKRKAECYALVLQNRSNIIVSRK